MHNLTRIIHVLAQMGLASVISMASNVIIVIYGSLIVSEVCVLCCVVCYYARIHKHNALPLHPPQLVSRIYDRGGAISCVPVAMRLEDGCPGALRNMLSEGKACTCLPRGRPCAHFFFCMRTLWF